MRYNRDNLIFKKQSANPSQSTSMDRVMSLSQRAFVALADRRLWKEGLGCDEAFPGNPCFFHFFSFSFSTSMFFSLRGLKSSPEKKKKSKIRNKNANI